MTILPIVTLIRYGKGIHYFSHFADGGHEEPATLGKRLCKRQNVASREKFFLKGDFPW